ncbi:MAG: hypothetical protein HZA84_07155 [Thaumarchaeota archaeon]|nr:hypothetical protein [Nitrososphaerota archaeon]
MNLVDIILPFALVPLATILPGALKNRFDDGKLRICTKIGATILGAFCILFAFDMLVKTIVAAIGADSSYYIIPMILLSTVSFLLSWKLVEFGEDVGQNEHEGIRYDADVISNQVKQVFAPMLSEFVSNTASKITQDLSGRIDEVEEQLDYFREQEDMAGTQGAKMYLSHVEITKSYEKRMDDLQTIISECKTHLDRFSDLDEKYQILVARLESLEFERQQLEQERKSLESHRPDKTSPEDSQETVLTTQDGAAYRRIGDMEQEKMAHELRDLGFEVIDSHGKGNADYIIKKNNKTAIGSSKSYMLYDEPKRMQRRINANDVTPEMILAKKLHVPLVIFVRNRKNGRRWANLIPPERLNSWQGESTPVILAKDDPESGKILEEEFLSILASLGALV